MPNYTKLCLAMALAAATTAAHATNGYSPHGIGMTSKGMGGVYIAHQGDSVAVGGNPAGSAFLSDRMDFGIDLFRPIREASIGADNYDGSNLKYFPIPEFGYRRGIDDKLAFALSVFGNGGMNSTYKPGIPMFNGTGMGGPAGGPTTGINLMQLFVVPSLSYKVNENNSVGVGVNLVAQGFEAKGLGGFAGFSTNPAALTDNGTDWSYGAGIRVGWIGEINDQLTLGATYQSRTYMTDFDDYEGLFAGGGEFDIPSNFGVGFAFKASPKLTIAGDVQRIRYSEVDSVGNSINNFGSCSAFAMLPPNASCLGGANGPGFGWDDMTVFKLGVEFEASPELTLRAGWNYGEAPIPASETLFNVLAPATVEHHLTLGATWKVDSTMEVTAAYMHAFENEITDTSAGALGGSFPPASIEMYQDSIGVAVSWKL